MRWVLALLIGLVATCACRHADLSPVSDAERYVQELNTATDPAKINELSRKLYACGAKGLEPISEALLDYEYRAKPQLVAIASAIPNTKAMWIVHKQLRNRMQSARATACYGLTLHPRAPLRDAVQVLRKKDDADQEWGMYALAASDHPQRKALFVTALKSSNPYVRAQAIKGFRTLPGKESIALIASHCSDKDELVAAEAFLTLARLDPKNALVQEKLRTLGENIVSGKAPDRQGSIRLLSATRLPAAEPYLSKLLGDPDPRMRVVAANGYSSLGKAAKTDRLVRSLTQDPDLVVRLAIANCIGKLGRDGLGPDLLKLAKSKDSRLAQMGVETLATLRRHDCTLPLLEIAEKSTDPALRRRAAVGLSNMGIRRDHIKGIDEIMAMSQSPDPAQRREATTHLGDLQGPRFHLRLQEMIEDPDSEVRIAAMEAMKKQIGMPSITPKVMAHPPPSWLEE